MEIQGSDSEEFLGFEEQTGNIGGRNVQNDTGEDDAAGVKYAKCKYVPCKVFLNSLFYHDL